MGLFEDIGRKVGKLGHEAREATREQATARCAECETLVYTDRDTCPECGSDRLVSRAEAGDGVSEPSSAESGDGAPHTEDASDT